MKIDLDLQQKEMDHQEASALEEREEAAAYVMKGMRRQEAKQTAKELRFLREEAERKGETFNDEDGHPIAYWDASLNHPAPQKKSEMPQVKAISKAMFGE